jgi:hypothetical protein
MLESIFDSSAVSLSLNSLFICLATSLILGLVISIVHIKTTKSSKNLAITLAVLPTLISLVIIMVNGNLGTSVAVLGAFSLIRFRSAPGNSKEIMSVFFAMTIGLAVGMGEIVFAIIITIIISIIFIVLEKIKFGGNNQKKLIITIPENLDYTNLFEDIFEEKLDSYSLEKTKTTNMGSLFELTYLVSLKNDTNEKVFIDQLRCRNGNLKIILTHNIEGEL